MRSVFVGLDHLYSPPFFILKNTKNHSLKKKTERQYYLFSLHISMLEEKKRERENEVAIAR